MHHVYIIRSIAHPNQTYIGYTKDLSKRMLEHNNGSTFHTAKYKPWELIIVISFIDEFNAHSFEKYLKSGNGRVFIAKRLMQL